MAQTQSEKAGTSNTEKAGAPATASTEQNPGANSDPIAMLSEDHRRVEQLFAAYEKATGAEQKSQLAEQICTELTIHTLLEEEIFYPACQGHMEQRLLDEAQVEHDGAKTLIIEIRAGSPDKQYFDAKAKVLSEDIKHHVREEEKPGSGIFAKAKEGGIAVPELAKRLATRKQELMEQAKAGDLGPPETRSFRVQTNAGMTQLSEEHKMARGTGSSMERERDERGRFVSDDDDDRDYRRRSSGRSRYDDDDDRRRSMPPRDEEGRFTSSRSRYDDDDDRRYSRSRSGYDDDDRRRSTPPRDEEGRFTSSRSRYDDDDDRPYSRSRSRYDDDDDDRRGRREHGGWFGDPEGHSEASRRGWEERGGGSRGGYRDDDRRRSMPARDDEGRFTSSRSRLRYDDDDDDRRGSRGHGGWFGDPEGHSEAAQRGWEERGGSRTRYRDDDDDDRRYSRSRSRDDDDDDRRGTRGHGGWYGDPEGHSQAARRGRR